MCLVTESRMLMLWRSIVGGIVFVLERRDRIG